MDYTYTPVANSFLKEMEDLTSEEYGELIRWCQRYFMTGEGEKEDLPGNAKWFANRCKLQLDYYKENLTKRSNASKENGKKGGRPKKNSSTQQVKNNEGQKPEKAAGSLGFSQKPRESEDIVDNRTDKQNFPNEEGFNRFWSVYPRKVGKQAALKSWSKLNPNEELTQSIVSAVEYQKTWDQWIKDGGQFIPHPATWLNQHRWEDQLPERLEPQPIKGERDKQLEQLLRDIAWSE